jgi:hypothetical protein
LNAFPTSRWRGAARLIGVPLAWYFATLIVVVMALVLISIEIVFSPRAIHCLVAKWARRCREWWTPPPSDTPPRAVPLAMGKPDPPLVVDAVSRTAIGR